MGGQAFSTLACMACGIHSQYSASRSAGVGGRTVRAALCPPACRRARPPAKPGPPRWPHPVPPAMPSPRGTLPGQTHIWGSSSKQPARRLGSRLSQQQGLSGGSLSWAVACGWGGRTWGVMRPTRWHHCQACPGTAGSPLPSSRLGVLAGWKDPDSIASHYLPLTRPPSLLPHTVPVHLEPSSRLPPGTQPCLP